MKNNKGITLIALVITIIVMLILVAVTITMAVNGGLFEYAKDATRATNQNIQAEQELGNLAPGMSTDQLIEKYTTGQEGAGGGSTGPAMQVSHNGGAFADLTSIGSVYYGDIVSIGTEQFYVIGSKSASATKIASASEISGANTTVTSGHTKLILLAMYNLNAAGTAQAPSENMVNNTCAFSSTNYWSSETTTYPADLNNETAYPIPEGATSIITIAKTYGSNLGGDGRLMTVSEVESLGASDSSTNGCPSFINAQDFWLGSASSSDYVRCVHSQWGAIELMSYYNGMYYSNSANGGVRPVVEISVS